MKSCLAIFILLISTLAFSQTKDRRAKLEIEGNVNEIIVSPDEKIWLVAGTYNLYYKNHIDSNWHAENPVDHLMPDSSIYTEPLIERISFFNKDTAIATGYISGSKKSYNKSGYYRTTDGGKTWKLLDFGGHSWIYEIWIDANGNAWMGGAAEELYYSNDFGKSWRTIKMPYKSSDRTYSIYMSSEKSGIAGSNINEILTTENNWKTVARIKTPLDQGKYKPDETALYIDKRISKIVKWNNYIVVNQYGHIFYSDANVIEWKAFPVSIADFELDVDSKKLFAVTDSLKIVAFSSPTTFQYLSDEPLVRLPRDMKAVNGSLYIVDYKDEVYKVNENTFTHTFPYTTDKKIPEPDIVKQFSKLKWGIAGNQIYLIDHDQKDWYRENELEFWVDDFMLLSDSVAILWDGTKNNYIYSLKDHTPHIYLPANPLKSFLAAPVKYFSINSVSSGCYHCTENEVRYYRTNDSTLTTSWFLHSKYCRNMDSSTFQNKVKSTLLSTVLASINLNPSAIPSIKDFQITEEDKKNYLKEMDERFEKMGRTDSRKNNKDFYYAVPAMLDTLDDSVITAILNEDDGWTSTSNAWFRMQIINQNNDTLNIYRDYYFSSVPWNLPWKCEYKGLNFTCYDIELSRFIDSCIPEDFIDKDVYDNKVLIMKIAYYLYDSK